MTPRSAALAAAALLALAGAARAEGEKPAGPPAARPGADSGIPADTEVKTMPSGLKYSVLKAGTGKVQPRRGDRVKVHYTGWLEDGTEFDSSRRRGVPAEFAVGQLIEGWNEALTLMTEGARWKLTIPAAIAYGSQGQPPTIPPGATLVFDVELLSLRSAPAFRAPDAKAQKTTPSGLKYEVLEEGTGAGPAEGDAFEISYALWTAAGEIVESTEGSGRSIQGRKEEMGLAFLREAPFLMKEGSVLLLDVPANLCFGGRATGTVPPDSRTIWRLRLVRVGKPAPVPPFAPPPADQVKRTPSGLGIQVLKEGAGESPKMGEEVVVHYAGWLTDGTVFDASFPRGLPATFRLGEVIPGWNEGLQAMKPGGVAMLVIPADLAYGPQARGKIPANSTLVFRVELLEVRK